VTEAVFNFAVFIVFFILSFMWKDNSLVQYRPRQSETLRTSYVECIFLSAVCGPRSSGPPSDCGVPSANTLGWCGCSVGAVPPCHGLTKKPCSSVLKR
jgi:hypothetical protein